MNQATEKYLISASVGVIILCGVFAYALAAVNYFYPRPMVIQVNQNGRVLLRGTIDSVNPNSLTVKSWGGNWVINISPSTKLVPVSGASQLKVGDFVGVTGVVNQNTSWTVDAKLIHDWTINQVQDNKPIIYSISGPTTLNVGQTGAWIINASGPQNGNLTYSVIWGDETNYSSMKANGPAAGNYIQSNTFTHVYSTAGFYTPKFYARDSADNTANVSMSVNVISTVTTTQQYICRVPCTGRSPSPNVVGDCRNLFTQSECNGYKSNDFPYGCTWVPTDYQCPPIP